VTRVELRQAQQHVEIHGGQQTRLKVHGHAIAKHAVNLLRLVRDRDVRHRDAVGNGGSDGDRSRGIAAYDR
jgi:hypothetical protein